MKEIQNTMKPCLGAHKSKTLEKDVPISGKNVFNLMVVDVFVKPLAVNSGARRSTCSSG